MALEMKRGEKTELKLKIPNNKITNKIASNKNEKLTLIIIIIIFNNNNNNNKEKPNITT